MPNPDLVEKIDRLPRMPIATATYRHVTVGRPPLSGEGARIQGGRWNPPERFPTLYLALSTAVAVAEFQRMATLNRRALGDFLPRELYRIDVSLQAVVDLRAPSALAALGMTADELTGEDRRLTQAIGDAAHYLSVEAILAPSAAGTGDVLAVFTDVLESASTLDVEHLGNWTDPSLGLP